ncbi:MAG: hypothetical protein ACRDYX_01320 [Egibacteraceae bacterium]
MKPNVRARHERGGSWTTYQLYGLSLRTDFCFENRLARSGAPADLTFRCSTASGDHEQPVAGKLLWPANAARAGKSHISLHAVDGHYVLEFADLSRFRLTADEIHCALVQPAHAYVVEIQFLGIVLALWLELQGMPALHASAVDVGGRAVAFVGGQGAGKTSMAATFLQGGCRLLTEDLLALELGRAGALCCPGYPQMRMWPDEARHFVPGVGQLEIVHPAFAKLRVPVGQPGIGSFCSDPRPLSCIYVLERQTDDARGETRIASVAPRDAVIELIRNSFVPDLVQATGRGAQRLALLTEIVRNIPVRRLCYPSGFDRLPEICDVVACDLAKLDSCTQDRVSATGDPPPGSSRDPSHALDRSSVTTNED